MHEVLEIEAEAATTRTAKAKLIPLDGELMSTPKRKATTRARVPVPKGQPIKALSYSTVSFFDTEQKRQVIVLYSLGEDGIVREYAGGKWNPFPITSQPT